MSKTDNQIETIYTSPITTWQKIKRFFGFKTNLGEAIYLDVSCMNNLSGSLEAYIDDEFVGEAIVDTQGEWEKIKITFNKPMLIDAGTKYQMRFKVKEGYLNNK